MKKICIRETGGKRGWKKMRRGTRPGKFFNYKVIRMQGCFVFDIRLRSYFFLFYAFCGGFFPLTVQGRNKKREKKSRRGNAKMEKMKTVICKGHKSAFRYQMPEKCHHLFLKLP